MTDFKKINEAVKIGDFTLFNTLNELEKVDCMKSWNSQMWDAYYLKDSISEDDLFDELFRIIDD